MNWTTLLATTPLGTDGGRPSGWDGHMMNMPVGGLPMILVLGAIVAFIILMIRGRSGGPEESSMDILKRRYANGEIDKEQFEQMKKELGE